MTSLYQAMLSQAVSGQMLSVREVSRFSAAEIRQTMAELVAADQVALADALAAAGQSLYPDSEDILCISALLCEIKKDWTGAEELLLKLIAVQNQVATPFTWRHLIRVQRCQLEDGKALETAKQALVHHAEDTALNDEFLALQDLVSDQLPVDASRQVH